MNCKIDKEVNTQVNHDNAKAAYCELDANVEQNEMFDTRNAAHEPVDAALKSGTDRPVDVSATPGHDEPIDVCVNSEKDQPVEIVQDTGNGKEVKFQVNVDNEKSLDLGVHPALDKLTLMQ